MNFERFNTESVLLDVIFDGEPCCHMDGRGPGYYHVIATAEQMGDMYLHPEDGTYRIMDASETNPIKISVLDFKRQMKVNNIGFVSPEHYSNPLNPHAVEKPLPLPSDN